MSTPKKTLTAAERAAKLQEMLAKEEKEAAERKQKLTEKIAAEAAKAEAEAEAAAARAAREASLAAFGVPVVKKSATRMTAAQKLALLKAQNEGLASANVVDPAAIKKAAEEAFNALDGPRKIEFLRAKAAADIAEAETKLAVHKLKIAERLARDIAAVEKEMGSPAAAVADLVSAVASSSSSSMAASSSGRANHAPPNRCLTIFSASWRMKRVVWSVVPAASRSLLVLRRRSKLPLREFSN